LGGQEQGYPPFRGGGEKSTDFFQKKKKNEWGGFLGGRVKVAAGTTKDWPGFLGEKKKVRGGTSSPAETGGE